MPITADQSNNSSMNKTVSNPTPSVESVGQKELERLELKPKDCFVDLTADRKDVFPETGVYPHQAHLIRTEFFPEQAKQKLGVNAKDCEALYLENGLFKQFLDSLLNHKRRLNIVNIKSDRAQAINTVCMALKSKGGGMKIPQPQKDFFINIIGDRQFDKKLFKSLMDSSDDFRREYGEIRNRYENDDHNCQNSIRQFINAHKKKNK